MQLGQDLLDGLDGDGGSIAIDVVPGASHHADLAVRSERGVGRFRGDPLGFDIGAPDFLFGVDGGIVAEDLERYVRPGRHIFQLELGAPPRAARRSDRDGDDRSAVDRVSGQ